MKKVIIVGAGLGGLAAGIRLAKSGVDVSIYEKNAHAGGKMMPVQLGDYQFDFGPNTITMPEVFTSVIEMGGTSANNYLHFEKIEDHTRNWFADGSSFWQSTNKARMLGELEKVDNKATFKYEEYLKEVNRLYNLAENAFFYRTFSGVKDYLSPKLASALLQVRPLQTMDEFHRQYFFNERTLQAFNRYSTYIGSSPYQCPATFALIGALEMIDGVYYTKGGNVNIAHSFAKVFTKLGGKLHVNSEVTQVLIRGKKVVGVELITGEKEYAEKVILNGDLLSSYERLIKETHRPHMSNKKIHQYEPSISAFVILAGVNKKFNLLTHHQVFFSSDYKKEFRQIFVEKALPDDPSIYVCNSATTDPTRTKGSNLFILVNAPALPTLSSDTIDLYKEKVYAKLKEFGLDILPYLEEERVITAREMQDTFYAYKGALYGISSHRKKDAFLRPSNKSNKLDGLYFTGGTTHPGGGSPMVTISGLNTAELILNS